MPTSAPSPAPAPAPSPDAQAAGRNLPLALAAWAFIGLVLVLAVALVAVKLTAGAPHPSLPAAAPAPAPVVGAVAALAPGAFDAAGGSAAGAQVLTGQPPLEAGGRVEVVFVGAESSPFSAAASWALVAALSRFGTFSHLGWAASPTSEVFAATPGFSFAGAAYRSPYVALEAVESDRAALSKVASPGYPTLEEPGPAVEALLRRFDGPGGGAALPFLDVGNRLLMVGASSGAAPGLLQGQSMSQVAARLAVRGDPLGQAVLGAADQIAAAVCAGDGAEPAAVCTSPGVRATARALGLP